MEIVNPFTVFTLIPIGFIVLYIFKIISKSGSMSVSVGKLFSVSHESDIKTKLDEFKIKIENIEEENASLKRDNEKIRKNLNYINMRIELRQEYKLRLYKLSAQINKSISETIEKFIKEKIHYSKANMIHSLDEHVIYKLIIKNISNVIIDKGLNDFDKNGFDTVASDNTGTFNQKQVKEYSKNKPDEFIQEIYNTVFELTQFRPLTITDVKECDFNIDDTSIENNIFDRTIIIPIDEFRSIVSNEISKISDDIIDIYDFMITKYNNMISIYKGG